MWYWSKAISIDMSSIPLISSLDILAIAAHRDDVEQTCGGTLLKAAQGGQRTGILDLTRGEMGTRGTAEDRAREADDAAKILGVNWRRALDIPDGRVENTYENRLKVATVIRETRPRVIILPYWKGPCLSPPWWHWQLALPHWEKRSTNEARTQSGRILSRERSNRLRWRKARVDLAVS